MKTLFLILLIPVVGHLFATELQDYPDLIAKTRRYLTVFPEDQAERLNLAYYYLQNAQPDSALTYYAEVLDSGLFAEPAASGKLWALNALRRYSNTITAAREWIDRYPANADLRNHRALAYLRSHRPLPARAEYRKALHLSGSDTVSFVVATEGLAWSYHALNDFARAERYSRALESLGGTKPPTRPVFGASLGMGRKDNSDIYYFAAVGTRWHTTSLGVGAEEYVYAGTPYRLSLSAQLEQQTIAGTAALYGRYLSGDDEMVYPTWQGGISLETRAYLGPLLLVPRCAAYYAYLPTFSSIQGDIGLKLKTDFASLSVNHSERYLDSDSPEADTLGSVFSAEVAVRIWRQLRFSLYYHEGDMDWWTSPQGVFFDTFEPNEAVLGAGLSLPISSWLTLNLYHQFGTRNETYNYLSQGSLAFSF